MAHQQLIEESYSKTCATFLFARDFSFKNLLKSMFLGKSLGLDLSLVPDANFKVLISVLILTLLENRLSRSYLALGKNILILVSALKLLKNRLSWSRSWSLLKCLGLGSSMAQCLGIFSEAVIVLHVNNVGLSLFDVKQLQI